MVTPEFNFSRQKRGASKAEAASFTLNNQVCEAILKCCCQNLEWINGAWNRYQSHSLAVQESNATRLSFHLDPISSLFSLIPFETQACYCLYHCCRLPFPLALLGTYHLKQQQAFASSIHPS